MAWARVVGVGLTLCIAIAGCSGIRVDTDYDPRGNFAGLTSYAWLPDPPQHGADARLHNDLVDGRVRSAVERDLAARGYRKTDPATADFLVTYYLGLENKVDVQTIQRSYGYGYQGWYGGYGTETMVTQYEEGTLLLDILTPNRELMWRGSAKARVQRESTPEQRQKTIDEAVEKMLDRFPPK